MKLLKWIKSKIRLFFLVDCALFWERRSLFGKIVLAMCVYVLLHLLLFGLFFGGVMLLGSFTFDLELSQSTEHIAQIEIIHVGWDDVYNDEHFDNITVCTVLEEPQWDTFLAELDNITCRGTGFDAPKHIFGPTIRITYRDGTFDLLSSTGFFFSSDTDYPYRARTLDYDELLELISTYGYHAPTA